MIQSLHIKNTLAWGGAPGKAEPDDHLYTDGRGLICAACLPDALTIDLAGYAIFPGLVNAHDHLELNHYPRTRFRAVYRNAHEWGEDVNVRLDEPPFSELRAYPLWDRVFIGGLKNLLCGATTVIQHGPPHKLLFRRDFPVRVLKRYGWAHSLHFSSDAEIIASYKATPPDVPWFIHLAEGTDEVAAGEYRRLKALGCAGANTVIVHGAGLTDDDIADAAPRLRGLVWCPTTNLYLLNSSGRALRWLEAGGLLMLGSDSRLTADGDLWDELAAAARCGATAQIDMVTTIPAAQLGLQRAGALTPGAFADWLVIPSGGEMRRASIALIVRGGVPQIGSPELMAAFKHIETVPALLDDVPKAIHISLARQIARCKLQEPGLILGRTRQPGLASLARNWLMGRQGHESIVFRQQDEGTHPL